MLKRLSLAVSLAVSTQAFAQDYADFPVTLKGYEGSATTSTAYTGQAARQVLHNSLKSLIGSNADIDTLLAYYEGKDEQRKVVDPVSKDGFPVKQSLVADISAGKNLSGKAYGGIVNGWPGQMTGDEVLRHLLTKAAESEKGYDPLIGYDYRQIFSKFAMGAVFYHQAVDVYLDERITAASHRNDAPYKDGAAYTGKEHVWDEAFGYFGAPAHALDLTPAEVYGITKQKAELFDKADANDDGFVDLSSEMAFAHAYYAAGADKGGKSNYLHTITQAFVDGRQLIADANGEQLTDDELAKLADYADTIKQNWERVIAEAAFKYAGSVYKDIQALLAAIDSGESTSDIIRVYAKHWGELKGFAMSLGVSGRDLGAFGVQLDRLIGFSPVMLGDTQVTGIDAEGNFTQSNSITLQAYALNMLKVQKLLAQQFHLLDRKNDMLNNMDSLAEEIKVKAHMEND